MMGGLLLDTCALIWLTGLTDDNRTGTVESALDEAEESGSGIFLSPISAWELGNMTRKGRVTLPIPITAWFEKVMRDGGLTWADLSVDVLVHSTQLPEPIHRDPADRIIVATAREFGLRVVTRDRAILTYAAQGHVLALPC
jgi:PIN domain nuclease of toxin-antitoxin system